MCERCGVIADVSVDVDDPLAIDGLDGFRPGRAAIVSHGICARCPDA